MNRKIYLWKLRNTELQLGERTLVMGVLNVTPDSFSDGGEHLNPDQAYARALEMEEQGADLIDVGGESTRPGSKRIGAEEEWQRLAPVLKRLSGKLRIPLSVDTYKSETAQRALDLGAEIINDPSGLTFDGELAKVAANAGAGLVLNHMRGTPETWAKLPPVPDVAGVVARELEACASRARRALVDKNRIVLDPGLGFGKRKEQNAELLAHLGRLAEVDYPVLVGPSRKSFLAQGTDAETLMATASAVTAAILRGAHIVRVHDVAAMRPVVAVADEIAAHGDGVPVVVEKTKPKGEPRVFAAGRPPVDRITEEEKVKPTRPPLAIRKLPAQAPAASLQNEPRPEWRPRQPFKKDEPWKKDVRGDRPQKSGPWERGPRSGAPGFDRTGKPPFRPQGDRPARPPRDTGDRPDRFSRPEGRPPRSGPPRGDSRGDGRGDARGGPKGGPRSGPPKRPFRKRP